MKIIPIVILFLISIIYPPTGMTQIPLYPQEKMMEFGGVQTLAYFEKGTTDKPLIIFIPGDSHLARIAYGYPQGHKKDFLAYSAPSRLLLSRALLPPQ